MWSKLQGADMECVAQGSYRRHALKAAITCVPGNHKDVYVVGESLGQVALRCTGEKAVLSYP